MLCIAHPFFREIYDDFKEKVKLCEDFVSKQYFSITDTNLLSVCTKNNLCISVSTFSASDILKAIRYLDPNKVHDHNMVITEMLKIYDELQEIEIG